MSLIEDAKNRNPNAFDQLMRTQLQRMYRIAVSMLQNEEDAADAIQGIAFCRSNCTYYFPEQELSDEQLLELIDFQIKVDYCRQRIVDEINRGVRSDCPDIEYVERERIITLDPDLSVDEAVLSQPWLKSYEKILNEY